MANVAPLDPDDPRSIGGYRLTGRIGTGGQGVVYLGHARGSGETVAVKLLRGGLGGQRDARERFLREAELAMQVASFCTARILSAGMVDDRPYIVSEYIDGPCLQARVAGDGPLSGGALERLAVGTATALTAIHQAGIVHRDLKPANVLLGPDGPRVIDFGIALSADTALTTTGQVVGTPAYMAPERFSGVRVGPEADIFSWGAMIAFAATGRAPFGTDTIPVVLNRVLNQPPELSNVGGQVRELIERCLDKDPARRPAAQRILLDLVGSEPVTRFGVSAPSAEGQRPEATAAQDLLVPDAAVTRVFSRARGTELFRALSPARLRKVSRPSRGVPWRLVVPAGVLVALTVTIAVAAQPAARTQPVRSQGRQGPGTSSGSTAGEPVTTARVRVPELGRLPRGAAAARLRTAGLGVGEVTTDCSVAGPGTVARTAPAAGAWTARGRTVDLVLAGTKAKVLDGKGWPVTRARQAFENSGFVVTVVRHPTDSWYGRVYAQSPVAGALACPGSPVVLSVGVARAR